MRCKRVKESRRKMRDSNSLNHQALPKRTENHRIDSLAMRFVRKNLPNDWIDRDLSERDYGIDLAIEIFCKNDDCIENNTSTGLLSLIQVKGTTIPLGEQGAYYKYPSFPVKTLNYAMQFKIPFFLIVVPVEIDSLLPLTAHFLWLQDYVRNVGYGLLNKNWRKQKTITLFIPKENDFVKKQNFFEECVNKDHSEMKILDAMQKYFLVKNYIQSISHVNLEIVMKMFLDLLESIDKLDFLKKEHLDGDVFDIAFDVKKMKSLCQTIKRKKTITEKQNEKLQNALKKMDYIICENLDDLYDNFYLENANKLISFDKSKT